MSEFKMDAPAEDSPLRKKRGLRRVIGVFAAVLIFAAGGASALIGERLLLQGGGDEVRVRTFEDWRVVCPPRSNAATDCVLSQEVAVSGQGGVLVSLALTDPTLGSRLAVTVPHGVLLDSGLGFSVGDQPYDRRPYETCTVTGCRADVIVDATRLALLREHSNGQISVVPGDGAPVTIPYSLNGFGDGYDALARERLRRSSFWRFLER